MNETNMKVELGQTLYHTEWRENENFKGNDKYIVLYVTGDNEWVILKRENKFDPIVVAHYLTNNEDTGIYWENGHYGFGTFESAYQFVQDEINCKRNRDLELETKPDNVMKSRIRMLNGMDEIVRSAENEDLLEPWLMGGVPDAATEDDYESMAEDDEDFAHAVNLFLRLIPKINEDGIYLGRIGDMKFYHACGQED